MSAGMRDLTRRASRPSAVARNAGGGRATRASRPNGARPHLPRWLERVVAGN
jgi:hypothetical protein